MEENSVGVLENSVLPPGFRFPPAGFAPLLTASGDLGDGPLYGDNGIDMILDRTGVPPVTETEAPNRASSESMIVSFRDTVANKVPGTVEAEPAKEWELEEGDVMVDKSGQVPKVTFSSRTHAMLAESMKLTACVRLLGRNIGYRSIQFQIIRLWKPKGIFHLIDLGNNYYMVRFTAAEDYFNALTNGPWVIFGSYLLVMPWSPSFSPESNIISSIVAWIRLPNLPLHLYHKGILKSIVGAIGKVYKVDHNTSSIERGKYARFAVGIDLTKPLLAHLEIEGRKQRIEYEGLPSICFKCGTYGHLQGSCPSNGAAKPSVPGEEGTVNPVVGGGPLPGPMNPATPARELATNSSLSSVPPSKEESVFGPWMQVSRRNRRPAVKDGGNLNHNTAKPRGVARGDMGSRFVPLAIDNGEQKKSIHVELGPSPRDKSDKEGIIIDNSKGKGSGKQPTTSWSPNILPTATPSLKFILPTPQVEPMGKEHHDGSGESSGPVNPKKHVDRNPLQPLKVNNRILDPTKHTVAIIEDDSIYFGPSSFGTPQSRLSSLNNKENFCYSHEPPKAKRKGINLSKNLHKTIKIRSPKNQPSSQPSEQLKMAILNSLSGMEASPPERN